uniref:Uncharacterized protein n=1 Tax=Acrobeloides nanus TaxID=290746 RepID=A0A914CFR9_9BILA
MFVKILALLPLIRICVDGIYTPTDLDKAQEETIPCQECMEGDFVNLNDFEISKLLTVAFQRVDGETSGECLSMTLTCSENHLKLNGANNFATTIDSGEKTLYCREDKQWHLEKDNTSAVIESGECSN